MPTIDNADTVGKDHGRIESTAAGRPCPFPASSCSKGVRDMVRISDARMSRTAFGTIVLHVVPESAVGGSLALVEDGDLVELDVPDRARTGARPGL